LTPRVYITLAVGLIATGDITELIHDKAYAVN